MKRKPELTIFYDGLCYICNKEVEKQKKRDKKNEMLTVDITKDDFNAKTYGLEMSALVAGMHAITKRGEVIVGVEVFRRMYQIAGLGFLLSFTKLPVLKQIANFFYYLFAKVRPSLSKFQFDANRCDDDECRNEIKETNYV